MIGKSVRCSLQLDDMVDGSLFCCDVMGNEEWKLDQPTNECTVA